MLIKKRTENRSDSALFSVVQHFTFVNMPPLYLAPFLKPAVFLDQSLRCWKGREGRERIKVGETESHFKKWAGGKSSSRENYARL